MLDKKQDAPATTTDAPTQQKHANHKRDYTLFCAALQLGRN